MNYPDSVNPGDPAAPWNEKPPQRREYVVSMDFYVTTTSMEEAVEKVEYTLENNRYSHQIREVFEA